MSRCHLRTDCRHFHSDRPCLPHKQRGKVCSDCDEYDPLATRVLVIKLAAMGDVLRTTCILRGLKAKFQAPIVWITRPEAMPLLEQNPWLDEIWIADDALAGKLEAEPFRAVVNVDAERGSAAICAMARAQQKIGFSLDATGAVLPLNDAAHTWFLMGINDQLKHANTRTYQELIADIVGLPASDNEIVFTLTEAEYAMARQFAARSLPARPGPVIGFNTGGSGRWRRKQWTFAGFEQLGRQLLKTTAGRIVLYGGRGEEEFNNRLQARLGDPRVVNVNTQHSVREFGALLSLCDVLVTGDTLGMHLALALGKKVVAIFGPTSAPEIELYGRGIKIVPQVACQSFYRSVCDASPCCVETIAADRVFAAVQELL